MRISRHPAARSLAAAAAPLVLVAACTGPVDLDLREGAFGTSQAALNATADRPTPDARGVISYPSYQVAVARRGDTVTDVAARVGLPPAELARFNGVQPGDVLREGEIMALPRKVEGTVDIATLADEAINAAPDTSPTVQTTVLTPSPSPKPQAAGPEPVRHKVKRGETAYTISRLYQVPVKSLAEWNGLGPDFAIREGQFLLIPVKGTPAPMPTVAVTGPGTGSPTPTPPSATTPLPDEKIDPKPPEAPKVSVGTPSQSAGGRLAYPVSGKIVRDYKKGSNEGIDIAAAPGTPVTAAEAGSVAAITQDADGVPIIVLRHKDNLLTVYANVDNIAVKKGDSVRRGQRLAQLRGGDSAYVHFEVRNGFDSVDPTPYLR